MGAYQIFNIEFKNKKDRDKAEKVIGKRMFQYEDGTYDCTYYMGWYGYGHGLEILKKFKKIKVKPIKFLSMDLSTQSTWFDEIKQYTFERKTQGGKNGN